MNSLYLLVRITLFFFHPLGVVWARLFSKHKLYGTWCCCWKCDPNRDEFRTGSVEFIQIFNRHLSGAFYSGSDKFTLEGDITTGTNGPEIQGRFKQNDEWFSFTLEIANCLDKNDCYKGRWSGYCYDSITGKQNKIDKLPIYIARNKACKPQCQVRRNHHDTCDRRCG
ncbi:MAG: hypothetical protein HQL54_10885 [Magnetococcales bacterium]|nr:hypothetical protein [Magnetococcales bacterium]